MKIFHITVAIKGK